MALAAEICLSVLTPWFFMHALSVHWHFLVVGWLLCGLQCLFLSNGLSFSITLSKDVRVAKASRTKVCNPAHSLLDILTGCGTSCLMKLSC